MFINTAVYVFTKYPVCKHGVYKQKCVYVFACLFTCVCVFVYEKKWGVFTFACLFTKKIGACLRLRVCLRKKNTQTCLLVYLFINTVFTFTCLFTRVSLVNKHGAMFCL